MIKAIATRRSIKKHINEHLQDNKYICSLYFYCWVYHEEPSMKLRKNTEQIIYYEK